MRFVAAIFVVTLLSGLTQIAWADMPEAREVARINNCPPKKIEVYQQSIGSDGTTIYRVDCNMPKATGETGKSPDSLLISCDKSLCELLRPLPPTEGK